MLSVVCFSWDVFVFCKFGGVDEDVGDEEGSELVLYDKINPLPRQQIIILCLIRITEPISHSVIHPFINQLVQDLKVTLDRSQIGFYTGIFNSIFALSQLCTTYWWSRLSDKIGRKPVILLGLLAESVTTILIGFQHTFIGLIIIRALAGATNGNMAVIKSSLAEVTDPTNKARYALTLHF